MSRLDDIRTIAYKKLVKPHSWKFIEFNSKYRYLTQILDYKATIGLINLLFLFI